MPVTTPGFNSAMKDASEGCQATYGQLDSVMTTAEQILDGPSTLIKNAKRVLGFMANTAYELTSVNNLLAAAGISDLANINLPDIASIQRALQGILECPGIPGEVAAAGNILLGQIDEGITTVEGLPKELLDQVFSGIQDAIHSKIDEVLGSSVITKIAGLDKAYAKLLEDAGISDALGMADSILDCLANICDTVEQAPETIDAYADSISSMFDDLGALPEGGMSMANNISQSVEGSVGEAFANASQAINNLRESINVVGYA